MTNYIQFIFSMFADLVDVLDGLKFQLYGVTVSYWSLIFAFIVVAMVCSVWWRGARG